MGFFDVFSGADADKTAQAAAADKYRKQQEANERMILAGEKSRDQFAQLAGSYDPYVQGGQQGYQTYLAALGLAGPEAQAAALDTFRASPGYMEGLTQGSNAITGNRAAQGLLNSGGTLKSLNRFGQDYATQKFGGWLDRLSGLGGQGLQATGAQVGTTGTGLNNEFSARQSAYQGELGAAGTIADGMVAGAGARAAGAGNIAGLGMNLAGMALGGVGGLGGLGSTLGNLAGGFGGGGATNALMGRIY
ncbi:MAG TPA: hypothetical protein VNQ99_12275 [Xanthobacteraceae bacterium]|nr:hypothetical protein [Xanthobacteraceae bacterium]